MVLKLNYLEKNVLYTASPDDQRCLALTCELPIASCPGKAQPALRSLDQKGTLQKRGSTRNSLEGDFGLKKVLQEEVS